MQHISRPLGIPDITPYVVRSDEKLASGGFADVYRGVYRPEGSTEKQIAIKTTRFEWYIAADRELREATERKTYRELEIWQSLQKESFHPNILPLLGIVESPIPESPSKFTLPSPVSEYCVGTLAQYIKTSTEARSRRIQLILDTLEGLSYIHGLAIVHGDLKAPNVLVTETGTAKICDFGHSRFAATSTLPQFVQDESSKFQSTTRYMSPELFWEPATRPSMYSDIWAFGCVALEILSKLRPYHSIQSDHQVPGAILKGKVPSAKPERPHAAACLNDSLWSVVQKCWNLEQRARPMAADLLNAIRDLIQQGIVSGASVTPEQAAIEARQDVVNWPDGLEDWTKALENYTKERISSRRMADIWIFRAEGDIGPTFSNQQKALQDSFSLFDRPKLAQVKRFIVKVPRFPGGVRSYASESDPFEVALRRVVREQFSLDHKNILELLGLDLSYGKYPGLALEFCAHGSLTRYKTIISRYEHSTMNRLMKEILDGLEHLHNVASVVCHGDLTPDNILIDAEGIPKISMLSFARLTAGLSSTSQSFAPTDDIISARYLSPELLEDGARPTPESDMWAFGCVALWILTNLRPYPMIEREHIIVSAILDGEPPNGHQSIKHIDALGGHLPLGPESPWITNGVFSKILRCWDPKPTLRPTATDFLKILNEIPEREVEMDWVPPAGLPELTGSVQTPGGRARLILGWSVGVWRNLYKRRGRADTLIDVKLWWWKGIYSRGFFRSDVEVIIKSVKTDTDEFSEPAKQVFKHELSLLHQIKHENISSLLGFDRNFIDASRTSSVPALIMEHCTNGKLHDYCYRNFRTLTYQDRVKLLRGIVSAVSYIHDQVIQGSIAHGSISMESILVDASNTPKLCNFEFSCQYEHSDTPITAIIIRAPPLAPSPTRWDAPEMFKDLADSKAPFPTRYTDLWSLGCLFVFVFCHKLPYSENELPGAIGRIMKADKPYPQNLCPRNIWEIADTLWERIPYGRASASKILAALDSL